MTLSLMNKIHTVKIEVKIGELKLKSNIICMVLVHTKNDFKILNMTLAYDWRIDVLTAFVIPTVSILLSKRFIQIKYCTFCNG